MRYRRFGQTNLQMSVFSLGTMRFASASDADETIAAAIARGINHIETAPAYGPSEQYIGQSLQRLGLNQGTARADLILTSKLTPTLTAEQVNQAIAVSLKRLGVSYLDCLALHGINTPAHLNWVKSQMLGVLAQAQADGRIRHVGFSTHGSLALILSAIATQAFAFINLHYNYFFQRHAPAIAQAHQQDMGIFIISPADKAGMLYTPPARLKDLCAPYEPLLLNYRWLLSDSRITTLSLGPAIPAELNWPLQLMDSKAEHDPIMPSPIMPSPITPSPITPSNIEPLNPHEQAAIARLDRAQQTALGRDRCAQCYACLPCPEAINIPEVLRLRNLSIAYDMKAFGQYRYGMFENAGHWFPGQKGNRCTDCGDCLPRCPEKLDIPSLLRDTHQRLNGKKRKRLWEES
ncbi:MAG: aldo/keto reductase [Phormidesmis sp. RL_2_1]|nr:aldo/keto reductase [Phormidesmis sp. RL_2_1]